MPNLLLEVVEMLGQTIAKVVPITIALALVFSVLTHFWACNRAAPWWRKRELVTELLDVRRMIEPGLAARAAKNATAEELAHMAAILERH